MKIKIGNSEKLEKENFHFSKKTMAGVILASTIITGGVVGIMSSIANIPTKNVREDFVPEEIEVSMDEINDLNIIINDDDCSDTFVDEVCKELKDNGLCFTVTEHSKGIDQDSAVVFTLDQGYAAGSDTIIMTSCDNDRLGSSDSLALSTRAAFDENGFFIGEISCGKRGFRQTDDGSVMEQVPSETEEAIGKDKNTSFVTISFGTDAHIGLVADSIVNSLGRYVSYQKGNITNEDLIYKVEDGDSPEEIAQRYHSTVYELNKESYQNNPNTLTSGQTIISPSVKEIKEFDKRTNVNIHTNRIGEKTSHM